MDAVSQAHGRSIPPARKGNCSRRPAWRKTPLKKLALQEQFANTYPQHEAAGWVYEQLLTAYVKANDADKALAVGDKLAAIPPECVEDAQQTLKAAEMKKDPDLVLKWSSKTSELAQKVVASTQPTDADEVENWKARVDYARQVNTYTEYSLYAMALGTADPAKQAALIEALQQRNPKSEYLAKAVDHVVRRVSEIRRDRQSRCPGAEGGRNRNPQRRHAAGSHPGCRQE
jgi:hypothetical protein